MMNALITGGSGFLGSYLAESCVESGFSVFGVGRRSPINPEIWSKFHICDCRYVEYGKLFSEYNITHIFYLAGSSSVPLSVADPEADFDSLLPALSKIASAIGRSKSEKPVFLLMSSAAVYGNPRQLPISESDPMRPLSPYGIHKCAAETLIENYSRLYQFPALAMRVFSAYGPGLRKQLLWDVVNKMSESRKQNEAEIVLHGTGSETRDFIHAKDVARAAGVLANHPPKNYEAYNIASGIETKISDVCSSISSNLDQPRRFRFNQITRPGDPICWRADISKLSRLGYHPSIPFDVGLKDTVDWIKGMIE